MPSARKAPKLWPAAPVRPRRIGARTSRRSTAPESRAPNERSAVVIARPSTGPRPEAANSATRRSSRRDAGPRPPPNGGRPGAGGHERSQVERAGSPGRPQEPGTLADDLPHAARPQGGKLVPDVLGQGGDIHPH